MSEKQMSKSRKLAAHLLMTAFQVVKNNDGDPLGAESPRIKV